MQKQKLIWGKYEGNDEQLLQLSGGYCQLELKHFPGGWAIASNQAAEPQDQMQLSRTNTSRFPENPQLFQTGRSSNLFIQPALPPKPVVFRAAKTISIRQHQTMRIYLAAPLHIQLFYKSTDAENLLAEFATERLSDTWFGEPDAGIAAFAAGSRFGLQPEQLALNQHEVLIPVNIQNNSTQLLDLQRLLVRVELMNLYQVGDTMVSDMTFIEFKGPGQTGQLNFGTDKGLHGSAPLLLAKARQASNRNLLGHSFHFIKQFTQL